MSGRRRKTAESTRRWVNFHLYASNKARVVFLKHYLFSPLHEEITNYRPLLKWCKELLWPTRHHTWQKTFLPRNVPQTQLFSLIPKTGGNDWVSVEFRTWMDIVSWPLRPFCSSTLGDDLWLKCFCLPRILLSCRLYLGRCNTRNGFICEFRNLDAFWDVKIRWPWSQWKVASPVAFAWQGCDCDNCGAPPVMACHLLVKPSESSKGLGFQKHQDSWWCLMSPFFLLIYIYIFFLFARILPH